MYCLNILTVLLLWCIISMNLFDVSLGQNLDQFVPEMGGTLCRFLAMKFQIARKYLRECDHPTCGWDDWTAALHGSKSLASPNNSNNNTNSTVSNDHNKGGIGTVSTEVSTTPGHKKHKQRIVLSYSHNGFGNQLWEHTVAFMVAEGLKARLLIGIIPDNLCFDGATPPNTFSGMSALERLLPEEFKYDSLPADSPEKQLCENEPFFITDRPRDWRDKNYTSHFKGNMHDILSDPKPRCLKMLGYFQNYPLCAADARQLWTTRMFANYSAAPGPNDISIYLRCLPRHYHFNDKHFYETILNGTTFDKVWLFQAPECPTRLGGDPSRDGLVAGVVRMLITKYNATRFPVVEGMDDTSALLYDLSALAQSKKMILPVSSWAYWAGMLSNATEIHVNGPPHHPMMPDFPNYIYHNEKARLFYGRFNASSYDIDYALENPVPSAN